jgi:hypothetical protein
LNTNLLRLGRERRQREVETKNNREPDQSHGRSTGRLITAPHVHVIHTRCPRPALELAAAAVLEIESVEV